MRMELHESMGGERGVSSSRLLKALYAPVCVRAAEVVQSRQLQEVDRGRFGAGRGRMIDAKAACMRCIAAMYPVTAVR